MAQTANLKLTKPARGEGGWDEAINGNMDIIDAYVADVSAQITDSPEIYVQTGVYNGTTGATVALPKNVSSTSDYGVFVNTLTTLAAVGDIVLKKSTGSYVIHNAQNNTTDTYQALVAYKGDLNAYGSSQFREWIVSTDAAITDHGDATDTGSLAWVLAQVGANNANVRLPGQHTYQIAQNVTVAANVGLRRDQGAVVDLDVSIRSATYRWTQSGADADEYYLELAGGGNPGISTPTGISEGGVAMTAGTSPGLAAGEWDWSDNDALGFSTVYVRLTVGGDPDGQAAGYVDAGYTMTINGRFSSANVSQAFDHDMAGSVVFGPGAADYVYPDYFGSDTDAFKSAMLSACASNTPLKMLAQDYTLTDTITITDNVNVFGSGAYEDGSTIIYTGPAPMFLTTAKLISVHWRDFRVDTTGNANANVDIFDFDYGVTSGYFCNIVLDLTNVVRHGWIVRGVSVAAAVANNNQYNNEWHNCRNEGAGAGGYSWYMYGQDVANARCNGNKWYNCVVNQDYLAAWWVNGMYNYWNACVMNLTGWGGTYPIIVVGNVSESNTFANVSFDNSAGTMVVANMFVKLQRDATEIPIANFIGCCNLGGVGGVLHRDLADATDVVPPRVTMLDNGGNYFHSNTQGSPTSQIHGFRTFAQTVTAATLSVAVSDSGKTFVNNNVGSSQLAAVLPPCGATDGYARPGYTVGFYTNGATRSISVAPYTGSTDRICYLSSAAASQTIKIGNAGGYVELEASNDIGIWLIKSGNEIIVPITASGTIGQRGCMIPNFTWTNEGASTTMTLTLATGFNGNGAAVGKFVRVASQAFRVKPKTGVRFQGGATDAKYKELGSDGAIMSIRNCPSTIWQVENSVGTINDEP